MKTLAVFLFLLTTLLCRPAFGGEIHRAAEEGDIEKVKAWLPSGADVNVKDDNGATPLHLAAENNRKKIVELLLARGADVNAKDNNGETPLDFAVNHERNNDAAAALLRAHGGKTTLHIWESAGFWLFPCGFLVLIVASVLTVRAIIRKQRASRNSP